ncbi:DNA replication/repair protein RecF [Thioalkalivibrio sulfidiphilus]|uniref:DNA replication/repair protein RecF n=1 Tax=Thioalkalivibrio sulfidiphilus TaxID=1033854 RepID=UPI000366C78D|nr:DNA replication/repair protein RecF [Thioalkalivibrio sulfidiphilus]
MTLSRLEVRGLRILRHVRMDPVPGLNLVHGLNGAGKTSLLEAIHLLSTGHSFRTRQLSPLLAPDGDAVEVVARIQSTGGGEPWPVGIRKTRDSTTARIRGENVRSLADLARLLPLQVMHPESHLLVSGGPGYRRAFLDWGCFHTDPAYHDHWRRYRHLLSQRNAALRDRSSASLLSAWDTALGEAGCALDLARARHLKVLLPYLDSLKQALPETSGLVLEYRRGWSPDISLAEALAQSVQRDRSAGFTQVGPHRAELQCRLDGRPVAQVASRGQQKSVVLLLKMAQSLWLRDTQGLPPVVLVDDLPAELDARHRGWLMECLQGLGAQVFVTAIESDQVPLSGWDSWQMFHVEHGTLRVGD